MKGSFLFLVGMPTVDRDGDDTEDVWWCRDGKGSGSVEVESSNHDREEVGNGSCNLQISSYTVIEIEDVRSSSEDIRKEAKS